MALTLIGNSVHPVPDSPSDVPPWLRAAERMPLAFAQVREDPLIDQWVVNHCAIEGGGIDVIQIASGGCTAAVLAAMPQVANVHLVDPNRSQLALTRLKFWLLGHYDPASRLAILGHTAMPAEARADALQRILGALDLKPDCLGPLTEVARLGPDHAGRYELLFAALRQRLAPMASALNELLTLNDVAEQQRRTSPNAPLGRALDEAFAEVMALEHLVHLFGVSATGNAAQPFHRHFAARLRHVLATLPAATNPYLWQLLRGTYSPAHPIAWIAQPQQQHVAQVTWTEGTMEAALEGVSARFHVVHLSNILDWLSPEDATRTLALAWRALRPGGWAVIRQLNSTLDIPALGSEFDWSSPASAVLHLQDRSFFYRTLHLGRKP